MIYYLGYKGSKRYEYFKSASEKEGVEVKYYEYDEVEELKRELEKDRERKVLKLDPTGSLGTDILKLETHMKNYVDIIRSLPKDIEYVNTPEAIELSLDKKAIKRRLLEGGVEVTPFIDENFRSFRELFIYLKKRNINKVFLKPNKGAGGAGVFALEINFENSRGCSLKTSAYLRDGSLYNTGKIRNLRNIRNIKNYVNALLREEYIVEEWIEKDTYDGRRYDLRVVVQFGKIEYIIGRTSVEPITNLHLNNSGVPLDELGLSKDKIKEVEDISKKVVDEIPGMKLAGIDILLSKGRAYVIEVNGQGDCIYKDMYDKNQIYRNQVRHMKELEEDR